MSYRVDQLLQVQKEAAKLFEKKNADYGDSFANYGPVGVLVRIGDKIQRMQNISKTGVTLVDNESIRDTLVDLHNYSAMAVMLIDETSEQSTLSLQEEEEEEDIFNFDKDMLATIMYGAITDNLDSSDADANDTSILATSIHICSIICNYKLQQEDCTTLLKTVLTTFSEPELAVDYMYKALHLSYSGVPLDVLCTAIKNKDDLGEEVNGPQDNSMDSSNIIISEAGIGRLVLDE